MNRAAQFCVFIGKAAHGVFLLSLIALLPAAGAAQENPAVPNAPSRASPAAAKTDLVPPLLVPRASATPAAGGTLRRAPVLRAPAATAPALAIEAAPDDPKGDIVELPRYVVTDSRILPMPESWRYTTLPGFEILSNAYDFTTRRFLKDFQQLQTAIGVVWPALINHKGNIPTLLILCARGDSFRPFIPDSPDPDIFITPTSLFVEDKERGAIVIDFMMQDVLGGDGFLRTSDPYEQFYRQYARFLMRRANNNKPIPLWLEEGLSRLFTTLDFGKKHVEFGKVEHGFGGGAAIINYFSDGQGEVESQQFYFETDGAGVTGSIEPGRNAASVGAATSARRIGGGGRRFGYIMPFGEMFEPGPRTFSGGNWSGQCFAFVHMCIYGLNKKYQKGFLEFAKHAIAGPVDENIFKQCFKRTYKQMAVELRGYTESTWHQYALFQVKRGSPSLPEPKPVELREATQAEIGRIKGEVLRLAGHTDASREALIVPYLRKESDANLLASLGLLETIEHRDDRARKFLEAAAKENVVRPRAYVELARLRLGEALASPAGPEGKLSVSQTARILEPLFIARKQPPSMEEVYSLIGSAWLHSVAAPKDSNLEILLEGVRLFPRSAAIVQNTAELYVRHGSPQTAAALIKLGLKIAPDSQVRGKFESLRNSLPADATPQPR